MAFDDLELEIEPQDIELEVEPVKKKTVKKPKKVTPKQEFKKILPPSIPEQIQSDKFKFETTPFRETPEQYMLRSTPSEKLSPQEKLKRERSLSLRSNKPLDVVRAETPQEREETLRIGEAQEFQDKYGSGALRLRSGLETAGAMLAEPFKSAQIETRNILSGNLLAPIAEREAELERFRTPLSQGVNTGYDPLGSALETGIAVGGTLLPIKGGKPSVLGSEPFRGGARVGVRPSARRPPPVKQLAVGEGPPVSQMRQDIPLLPPPTSSGSIVKSPFARIPSPDRLARLDPGPIRPMADFGIMSERPIGSRPIGINISDDLSFDILPGMKSGEAPVMVAPQWVLDAVSPGSAPGFAGGWNIAFDLLSTIRERIASNAPSIKYAQEALNAIDALEKVSIEEGLQSVSLIGRDMSAEALRPKYVGHETFHAGQVQVGAKKMQYPTIGIHGVGWAVKNPYIQEIITKFPKLTYSPDYWARELPAYVAGRQTNYSLGISKDTDFLYDYLEHIMDLHGQDALDILQGPTRLSPEITEIFNSVRSTYESKRSSLGLSPRSLPTGEGQGAGGVGGAGRGVYGDEGTGIRTGGDQGETGNIVGGAEPALSEPPPGRDPVEWYHSQLEKIVEGPKFPNRMSPEQAIAMFRGPYDPMRAEGTKDPITGKKIKGEITGYQSRNPYGIDPEIYEKSGIDELIARKAVRGEQVTKDELLETIRTNQVRLEERVYGQSDPARVAQISQERKALQDRADNLRVEKRALEQFLDETGLEMSPDEVNELFSRIQSIDNEISQLVPEAQRLNREEFDARGTPAPHTQWRALEGGIPGTDREIVISIPPETSPYRGLTPEEIETNRRYGGADPEVFTTPHYPGAENPIVHIRINEMPSIEGKKVLALQEVQSDLHQKGREKGYDTPAAREELNQVELKYREAQRRRGELHDKLAELQRTNTYWNMINVGEALYQARHDRESGASPDEIRRLDQEHQEATGEYNILANPIHIELDMLNAKIRSLSEQRVDLKNKFSSMAPDLPFKQTWIDLAVKRVIRWAADNGFEKIVWPTGKMQIDLYEDALRQNVKAINWESDLDGINLYPVKLSDPLGGGAYYEQLQKLTPERLKEVVGPKIADQILSQIDDHMGRGIIEGDDLSIGGQLHKFVYDTRLPIIFKEYAKKFGGEYRLVETDVRDPKSARHARDESGELVRVSSQPTHFFDLSPKLAEKAIYEGFAMSEKPQTYEIGDRIKVKGMGPAKVTKVFEDGVEVTYESNNVIDEINFEAIEGKITEPAKIAIREKPETRKGKRGIPSIPGPMRIKGNRLFVNRMGPGDEPGKVKIEFGNGTISQFNLKDVKDASGKKIKDPIFYMLVEDLPEGIISPPPPPTPRDPSHPPGGDSPLFTPIVGVTHTRVIAKKFIDLMLANKIQYDSTKAPSTQIYEAMIRGDLKDSLEVEAILKEEGVEWEDYIEDVLGTYSLAGKTLQPLSQIEQRHWKRLRDENPALFNRLIPAHRQIMLILNDLNKTNLGMSLWRRSGRMIQKAVLTQVATAATNFIGATGRVPLDAGSSAIGQAMRQMMEGEGTFGEKMEKAREAARETFKATFEAWRALNPMQIENLTRGQLGKEYEGYEQIVQQLETHFPDLHAKLFTKPMEETTQRLTGEKLPAHVELDPRTKLVGARENVLNMRKLLPKVKNEDRRRELQQEINTIEKNIEREESVLVKFGFKAPEMFYDQLLRPMQFAEFLMRRARFASRLGLELKDKGLDLNQIMSEGTFNKIPPELIKNAINDALEFTMALEPTNDPDASNLERASYHVVKLMNHLGPLALVTDTLFIRAMYSAFNTFYEYSPLPLINPGEWMEKGSFGRIFRGKDDIDPSTGEPYRVNPTSRDDYDKFGRMVVGTILYFLAWGLIKYGLMGDNWYEVKTPEKNEKGNPIYVDIRKYIPQARIFQAASLVERGMNDRLNDIPLGREVLDIATGIKRYETDADLVSTLDAMGEYWGGAEWNPTKLDKSSQLLGRYPAAFLTPLMNLRSIVAAHDKDENVRKDLRGYGFWGPAIDRIPFARQTMPDLSYPTFEGKLPLSQSPALQQFAGIQLSVSPEFIGREFSKMGINVREYLPKDPDPIIDKAQNEAFIRMASYVESLLSDDPEYITASTPEKMLQWEKYLPKMAQLASKEGLESNLPEANIRKIKRKVPGRFTREVTGLNEYMERLKEK